MNHVLRIMDTISAVRMTRADLAEKLENDLAGLLTALDEQPAEFWQEERGAVEKLRRRVAIAQVQRVAGRGRIDQSTKEKSDP